MLHTQSLARLPKRNCGQNARPFLARKLYRAMARILEKGDPAVFKTAEEVHALRRRCRRAKYLSEFAEPILGRYIRKLTHRLTHVTDALGNWHDADVQAELLDAMTAPPDDLRRLVSRRKHTSQRKFFVAWRRLTAPHFEKHVLKELRANTRT